MSAYGGLRSSAMRGDSSTGGADRSRGRTVLVIGDDTELAVALRDRLPRAYVTVVDVRPAEVAAAVPSCRPRPWLVVGTASEVPDTVVRVLAQNPTLLFWRGHPPARLPAHTRRFDLFSELAAAAELAVNAEVGGVRLAPGGGLTMPDGRHAGCAALEALVGNHPRPLFLPGRHLRTAAAVLDAHRVALRVDSTSIGGAVLVARAA
jgi:hypothetical protein